MYARCFYPLTTPTSQAKRPTKRARRAGTPVFDRARGVGYSGRLSRRDLQTDFGLHVHRVSGNPDTPVLDGLFSRY